MDESLAVVLGLCVEMLCTSTDPANYPGPSLLNLGVFVKQTPNTIIASDCTQQTGNEVCFFSAKGKVPRCLPRGPDPEQWAGEFRDGTEDFEP